MRDERDPAPNRRSSRHDEPSANGLSVCDTRPRERRVNLIGLTLGVQRGRRTYQRSCSILSPNSVVAPFVIPVLHSRCMVVEKRFNPALILERRTNCTGGLRTSHPCGGKRSI